MALSRIIETFKTVAVKKYLRGWEREFSHPGLACGREDLRSTPKAHIKVLSGATWL